MNVVKILKVCFNTRCIYV